jgi:hypothetical protein
MPKYANITLIIVFIFGISICAMSGCGTLPLSDNDTTTSNASQITEYFIGSDIIAHSNTIYLGYRPLTSTGEVTVKRNGAVVTWEADYVLPTVEAISMAVIPPANLAYLSDPTDASDGLATGTIKYLGSLSASDTVEVTYRYYNGTSDRYSGVGASSVLTYYLVGASKIVPGSEIVQIWRKIYPNPVIKLLTRCSTEGAFDGHYRINYTDPPSIQFISDPLFVDWETFHINDSNFTVIYKYVP